MAWEQRRGGLYYYRVRKVRGRVVREYVGGGLAGAMAEYADAADRAEREATRAAEQAQRARFATAIDATTVLCTAVEAAAVDALEASGYHRHDRGEWRRRRGAA